MVEIIKKIKEMQKRAESFRRMGKRIGLVPTMGFLHEGHLSLIRNIRNDCDVLVVSIFVNPTQFGPGEDFKEYPRDFERDKKLINENGGDIIFAPDTEEIYGKNYLTFVKVRELSEIMCGRSRPTHFEGVTTIVAKLFNIVKPHIAIFGQKDAQQAVIIKKMVNDLNFDVEIKISPIVREKSGIAMSSRNTYLNNNEKEQALALYKSLLIAREEISKGERKSEGIKEKMKNCFEKYPDVKLEYIEIRDFDTLKDLNHLKGNVLIAVAAKIGCARLIDNIIVNV
ncbi:pantoate--beta-alanine ligase [candidate division KSB1 bacterium]|nr:MAG: pantoate--beta-alanine ligase [candidate division KSB1 bacterium]